MADRPVRKGEFNSSFVLPILDLVMLVVLIGAGGYWWYTTRGMEQIVRSHGEIRAERVVNAARLDSLRQEIAEEKQNLVEANRYRQMSAEEIEFLSAAIEEEQRKLTMARLNDQQLTALVLDLNSRIDQADQARRSYQTSLLERDLEVRALRESVAGLEADLDDTLSARRRIEDQIASLQRERTRDPISMFPQAASLSSTVEMGGGDQRYYAVSLAGVLARMGALNLGIAGQVGLASQGDTSVKEGSFFANIPLAFRRASLDLVGGISALSSPTGSDELTPHAGAMLRYAPLRKERFFFLAGTKYRESDLNFQFGLGFGRR